MNLVTRCTACGTLFKVVADQLKVSQGWVRCGQCAHVFDAQVNLVNSALEASAGSESERSPEVIASPDAASSPAVFQADSPFLESFTAASTLDQHSTALDGWPADTKVAEESQEGSLDIFPPLNAKGEQALRSAAEHAPAHLASPAVNSAETEQALFSPGQLRDVQELDSEAGPSTASWAGSGDITQPPLSTSEQGSDDEIPPTPSFIKQAQRAARWRSPAVRLGLSLLALVMLALLSAQVALQEKDQIAARYPQVQPWLAQLCLRVGCRIESLKRIESIAIDSSSFNRIANNTPTTESATQSYKLAVTLKNLGALPIALPHVELSLQDARDQPLVRRVLSPADLGASSDRLTPAQEMAGQLVLQVSPAQLAGGRINGYRVLAFYP